MVRQKGRREKMREDEGGGYKVGWLTLPADRVAPSKVKGYISYSGGIV